MKKRRNIQLYKKRIKRRGKREWRLVIKLGSKLGDWEEIQRRKELATSLSHRAIALVKNDTIWKKNWKTKLTTRIQLYAIKRAGHVDSGVIKMAMTNMSCTLGAIHLWTHTTSVVLLDFLYVLCDWDRYLLILPSVLFIKIFNSILFRTVYSAGRIYADPVE